MDDGMLALMLGGGGARGAYQAGVLRGLGQKFPEMRFPILTGISAGAVNTIHLASSEGPLRDAADALTRMWLELTPDQVYDIRALSLARNVARWGARLLSGGISADSEPTRGMVDTEPLRRMLARHLQCESDGSLVGVDRNIARGTLRAVALSATSYTTSQSVTWVQGRDIELWERPQRRSESVKLTIDHVMASSALPMLFPSVRVNGQWYGDGGIRLTAPLSPALHLGATRIINISTRYRDRPGSPAVPVQFRYPPPAQVLGVLYKSIFLDLIDEDIVRLERMNRLLAERPPEQRDGMRVVDIMVIRPSKDLRALVRELEPRLPWVVRYLTRGLGTRETTSPDFLTLLMFQPDYIRRLIELGEADAIAQADAIEAFLSQPVLS